MAFIILFAAVSSWSRIILGAHYPSDCLFGVLMGSLICGVAYALFSSEITYCQACPDCYADTADQAIRSLSDVRGITIGLSIGLSFFGVLLSMSPPLHFWKKGKRHACAWSCAAPVACVCPCVCGECAPSLTVANVFRCVVCLPVRLSCRVACGVCVLCVCAYCQVNLCTACF
jgi:hypothetical protein